MTFEEEKNTRSDAVASEIINALDKKNLFLLNKKYPKLQRISIWLGVIGGIMSIPEHLFQWYKWFQ